MHKGVIILVKASDRDEAIDRVNEFMEPYGEGDVWDWFSIGNRWHNTLAPKEKVTEFHKIIHELYPQTAGCYSINEIENGEVRPIIQAEWERLGLRGKNPYWSAYGFDVQDSPEDYNVVPLSECLETVKEWTKDVTAEKERLLTEINEESEKDKKEKSTWSRVGYLSDQLSDLASGNFCFDSNVYNADTDEAETIPEDVTGYYAVMVDMHN
jgi:hypothetical protein